MTSRPDEVTEDLARVVVVLLGGQDAQQLRPLRKALPDEVRLAALQGTGVPPLVRVLDELAADGTGPVRLVGWNSDRRGARSWAGRVSSHWLRRGGHLTIRLDRQVAHELDELLAQLALTDPEGRTIGPDEAALVNDAWETTPPFDHQVLVCRGVRCKARGAEEASAALVGELARLGVLDDGVLVTTTTCLYPCNKAPVVVVNPGNRWVGAMTPENAVELATELATAKPSPG